MAPWNSHLRDNNTVGGTFAYIIGGFKLIIFSFGGGRRTPNFYMGGSGAPYTLS